MSVTLSSVAVFSSSASGWILAVASSGSLDELLCSSMIDWVLSKSVRLHTQEADGVEQLEHSLNPESLLSLQLRGSLSLSSKGVVLLSSSSSLTAVILESFMWLTLLKSTPVRVGLGLQGEVFPPKFLRDADKVARRPSALIAFPVFCSGQHWKRTIC
jgi:hypothetical protein